MDVPQVPRPHMNSATDHGPWIFSTAWVFVVVSILFVLTRLITRWILTRSLHRDDALIVISAMFALGQAITTSTAVSNGYGQHLDTLSALQTTAYQKSAYAGYIFFILSLAFAKISLGELIRHLIPIAHLKRVVLGSDLVIFLWAVTGIFVALFQCRLPATWDYIANSCVNRRAYMIYVDVLNAVTDLILVAIVLAVLIPLRVRRDKKMSVVACFSCRVFVIAPTIAHAYFVSHDLDSQDPSFDYMYISLTLQITQCLSIVTACVPYLKPFYISLQSGMLGSDDVRRRQNSSSKSYKLKYRTGTSSSGYGIQLSARTGASRNIGNTATALSEHIEGNTSRDADVESHSSQARIIRKEQTFTVERTDESAQLSPS